MSTDYESHPLLEHPLLEASKDAEHLQCNDIIFDG